MTSQRELDPFATAYVRCALWSSTDDSDESGGYPLDKNYEPEDLAPETLAEMVADCERFQRENSAVLEPFADCDQYPNVVDSGTRAILSLERTGHDFWLTRNGHGAGFWDGDWPEPQASLLTDASKSFGEYDLYIGDDGRIYGFKG